MWRVLIAGAGNFGREIANWMEGCVGANTDWQMAGFLNDSPDALDGYDLPEKIVGSVSAYVPAPLDRIVVAIGDPASRMRVVEELREKGAKFLTLIHKSAVISRGCKIGQGAIICPLVYVGGGASVGDFVVVNISSTVAHDVKIGEGSTLSCHCDLTGHVEVGKRVFMATHACVIPKIRIGDDSYIGAGSVIIRNLNPGSRVFGVPARSIAAISPPSH